MILGSLSKTNNKTAKGFFRPKPLPNDMVSALIGLYPTTPALGCPYNTGTTRITRGSLDKMACSIFGDLVQIAPARMIAQTLDKDGVAVYRYRFNHLQANASGIPKGIGTGVEQQYVFSNQIIDQPWEKNLAYQMSSAWIRFTHDLNPNVGTEGERAMEPFKRDCALTNIADGLPEWPRYGKEANSLVFNGYGSHVEQETYRSKAVEFLIENVLPYGAA